MRKYSQSTLAYMTFSLATSEERFVQTLLEGDSFKKVGEFYSWHDLNDPFGTKRHTEEEFMAEVRSRLDFYREVIDGISG